MTLYIKLNYASVLASCKRFNPMVTSRESEQTVSGEMMLPSPSSNFRSFLGPVHRALIVHHQLSEYSTHHCRAWKHHTSWELGQ
jgi:hypothetical protein